MHSPEEIHNHIIGHISAQSGLAPAKIIAECNFVAEGLLNSFSTLTLIISLEAAFGVRFDPVELADESAQTVGGLVCIVVRKQQEQL